MDDRSHMEQGIPRVLVAESDETLGRELSQKLTARGCVVEQAMSHEEVWQCVGDRSFDLVLLDTKIESVNKISLVKRIKDVQCTATVALLGEREEIRTATQVINDEVFDFVEKPLYQDRLDGLLAQALGARELVNQITFSRPLDPSTSQINENTFVGATAAVREVYRMVERLAKVNTSVLIRGENGTGKELVARAIHFNSPRRGRPFVAVNCGALPGELIESELFGHEKGSFTGAHTRKVGKFQYASGSTLFLDEVGDLPLPMQVKLLRVLQEQRISPVGSLRELRVDVRIVAATNRNLEVMMKEGLFRQDLYYRLNVMPLFLPPLRDRGSDIPVLIEHFVRKLNKKHSRSISGLADGVVEVMQAYQWPGNIRELENAIEHAFVVETRDKISLTSLPLAITGHHDHVPEMVSSESERGSDVLDFESAREEFEKGFIVQALKLNDGRINQTSDRCGIPKNTLLRKIKKYQIRARDYTADG